MNCLKEDGKTDILESNLQCFYVLQDDFLPKFYNISHVNIVSTILSNENLFQNLVKDVTENQNGQINVIGVNFSQELYRELIKILYCPKSFDPNMLSFDEVRQISVKAPTAKNRDEPRNYALWMPAASVLDRLSLNITCLIRYYLTAGFHSATLPNFLQEGCLV